MSNQRRVKVHNLALIRDPQVRLAIEELYRLIGQKQLDLDNMDFESLAAKLGPIFQDGQITPLNNFLDATTQGKRIEILFDGNLFAALKIILDGTLGPKGLWVDMGPVAAVPQTGVYVSNPNEGGAETNILAHLDQNNASHTADVFQIDNAGTGNFIDTSVGATLTNAGVWTDAPCHPELKDEVEVYTDDDFLDRLSNMRVTKYVRKGDPDKTPAISPSIPDLRDNFGVGRDDGISPMNVAGISLRGVQALLARVDALEKKVKELESCR